MNSQHNFKLIFKGAAMGIAEVIPGVSGGTIAFITGIYERLIHAIRSFDLQFIHLLSQAKFKEAWLKVDGSFLLKLLLGMVVGVVLGVFVISHLLENYPEAVWSFFFGLILASVIVIYKMLQQRSVALLVPFFIGTIVAFGIVSLNPQAGSSDLLYLFFCGMIAICALVLPGISGSFILLLLGMYTLVIPTLKNFLSSPEWDEFKIILVFASGCLIGILFFARFMNWTLKKYHDQTLAVLCGFMIGSLVKIWPWRNPEILLDKELGSLVNFNASNSNHLNHEFFEIVKEIPVLPSGYYTDPQIVMVLLLIVSGFVSVLLLEKFASVD